MFSIFYVPAALKRFLKMALMGTENAREKPGAGRKNRKKRLHGKAGRNYAWRRSLSAGPAAAFDPEPFEDSPRTAMALMAEPAFAARDRRQLAMRPMLQPALASAGGFDDTALSMELDERSEEISERLDHDLSRLDREIEYGYASSDNGAPVDVADSVHRMVEGNHLEISRLMERVSQIEQASMEAENQVKSAPMAPYWVSHTQRVTKGGPGRPGVQPVVRPGLAPAGRAGLQPPGRPLLFGIIPTGRGSARAINPPVGSQASGAMIRRGVPLDPAQSVQAAVRSRITAFPMKMNLLGRLANLRHKAEETELKVRDAEQHFKQELEDLKHRQDQQRDAKRVTRRAARLTAPKPPSAQKPKAPAPTPFSDPTKMG